MPLITNAFHTTVYTRAQAIRKYEDSNINISYKIKGDTISTMNGDKKEMALNQLQNLINQDQNKENGIKFISLLAKIKYHTVNINSLSVLDEKITELYKICEILNINTNDVLEFINNRNSYWMVELPGRIRELISFVGVENLEVDRDCKAWLGKQKCESFPTRFMPPLIDIKYFEPITNITSSNEAKNDDDETKEDYTTSNSSDFINTTKSRESESSNQFLDHTQVINMHNNEPNNEFKVNVIEPNISNEIRLTPREATISRNRAKLLNNINEKLSSDLQTRNCFEMLLMPPIAGQSELTPSERIAEINHLLQTNDIIIALGDGDIIREMLAWIWAGIVDLDNEGINTLISLMKIEAETLHEENNKTRNDETDHLRRFQENPKVKKLIRQLQDQIQCNQAVTTAVIGGDNIHDRLASEKEICAGIRAKMHEHGAIYIAGNHEDALEMIEMGSPEDRLATILKIFTQAGIWADLSENQDKGIKKILANDFSKIPRDQEQIFINKLLDAKKTHYTKEIYKFWDNHKKQVFQNAYYDQKTNTLYCHHGIRQIGKNIFLTAFGPIKAKNPAELARKMNGRSFVYDEYGIFVGIQCTTRNDTLQNIDADKIIATTNHNPEIILAAINNSIENSQISKERLTEIYSLYGMPLDFSSTGFRPSDNEMIYTAMNDENSEFNSLTIVHGHEAESNINKAHSTHNVTNINSRIERKYKPVMAIIPNKNYTLHESKPWWNFSRWHKV